MAVSCETFGIGFGDTDVITGTAAMFTTTGMVSGLFAAAGAFTVIDAVAMVDVHG